MQWFQNGEGEQKGKTNILLQKETILAKLTILTWCINGTLNIRGNGIRGPATAKDMAFCDNS